MKVVRRIASIVLLLVVAACITDPVVPNDPTPPDVAFSILDERGNKWEKIGPGEDVINIQAKSGDVFRVISRGYCKCGVRRLSVKSQGASFEDGAQLDIVKESASDTLLLGGGTSKKLLPGAKVTLFVELEDSSNHIVRTKTVNISVPDIPPSIGVFIARPAYINKTDSNTAYRTTLSYFVMSDSAKVTLKASDPQLGTLPLNPDLREGKISVQVKENTSFTLTAKNSGGEASKTITVRVDNSIKPTINLTSQALTAGKSYLVSWTSKDATKLTLNTVGEVQVPSGSTVISANVLVDGPLVYTLSAEGPGGHSSDSVALWFTPQEVSPCGEGNQLHRYLFCRSCPTADFSPPTRLTPYKTEFDFLSCASENEAKQQVQNTGTNCTVSTGACPR